MIPYDDVEELPGRANDTEYGLAASVWTRDVTRDHTLVAAIKAGTVFVNMPNAVDGPVGGSAVGPGVTVGAVAGDAFRLPRV